MREETFLRLRLEVIASWLAKVFSFNFHSWPNTRDYWAQFHEKFLVVSADLTTYFEIHIEFNCLSKNFDYRSLFNKELISILQTQLRNWCIDSLSKH